jgi:hypothetical protein
MYTVQPQVFFFTTFIESFSFFKMAMVWAPGTPIHVQITPQDPLPPASTVKPKFGLPEQCQIVVGKTFAGEDIYCPTRVASRTFKVIANLFLPSVWGLPDHKHHCRHCLRRVCGQHFKPLVNNALGGVSQVEAPLCSVCVAAGVLVAPPKQ